MLPCSLQSKVEKCTTDMGQWSGKGCKNCGGTGGRIRLVVASVTIRMGEPTSCEPTSCATSKLISDTITTIVYFAMGRDLYTDPIIDHTSFKHSCFVQETYF